MNLLTNERLPWMITLLFFLTFLVLIAVGKWRSTSTGAQVQVPMFYDAHYLFPRPWTQAQAAPGVPPPAPVAFYGPNTISQPFVSGADHLEMVEVWLAGPEETAVTAALAESNGRSDKVTFNLSQGEAGGLYALSFPQFSEAEGKRFILTLSAPEATRQRPVITHAVGGDKVGGAIRLNEYGRPGNLRLYTYVNGVSVWDALTEQLLPDIFRLRLQQFKPEPFKGQTFAVLFGLMVSLTIVFLVLARSPDQQLGLALGWITASLLGGLLIWQIGGNRVQIPFIRQPISMSEAAAVVTNDLNSDNIRIVNDLILVLWTANREPEERFVETTLTHKPAIHVPGSSKLEYALDVPRNGRFEAEVLAEGRGEMAFVLLFNDQLLAKTMAAVGEPAKPLSADLSHLAGQGGELKLVTEILNGEPEGYWLQPQLFAQVDWLLTELPSGVQGAGHLLGNNVSLLAYDTEINQDDSMTVTLFWKTAKPLTENATVFVHLLAENNELLAQSDSQPVQNSYPLTVWPADVIIRDEHVLPIVDAASLAVGLYDPADFSRWPVLNPDGTVADDGRVLLPIEEGR